MKYEAPYGVSDPNASYINGNPSTGTMGSIPPAASIENPQREIVNFETDSGLTPTDADLHQLSKAIQSGKVVYASDAGTPNFIAITPTPVLAAYTLGLRLVIKVANANTGPVKINASGLGNVPLINQDGSQLGPFVLYQGGMVEVVYDGAGNFQLLTGGGGGLVMMTAPRTFYVDAALGSDTLYDGTSATVSAPHGPFQTLQHALASMAKFNLGGWTFNIQMADGTYSFSSPISCPPPNGSGVVQITGNAAAPNCKLINSATGPGLIFNQGRYVLDGLFLQTTALSGIGGSCVWAGGSSQVDLHTMFFGSCPDCHFQAGPGGTISVYGPINIQASANVHQYAFSNAIISYAPTPAPVLNINTSVTFNTFAIATTGAQMSPIYGAINYVGGATVTGQRYSAFGNGVISTGGRGATYLPGTTAGVTATGGQYL